MVWLIESLQLPRERYVSLCVILNIWNASVVVCVKLIYITITMNNMNNCDQNGWIRNQESSLVASDYITPLFYYLCIIIIADHSLFQLLKRASDELSSSCGGSFWRMGSNNDDAPYVIVHNKYPPFFQSFRMTLCCIMRIYENPIKIEIEIGHSSWWYRMSFE
jgi:hypothetical protein